VVLTVREGKRELPEDKIPTEIMLLLMAAAVLLLYAGFQAIKLIGLTRIAYYNMSIAVTGISALIVSILFSFFYYSAVRRWKAHTFWKNSILRRLCHGMAGLFMYLYDNSAAVLRILVPSLVLLFLNLFLSVMTAVCLDTSREIVFVVFLLITLLADGLAIVFLYKSAMDRQHILDGIQKINAGDTGHKIDTASLHGDNLVLANEINGIGEGIRNAVDISMKDERLKADLITNVSHDIKTPLTSIINYVDLIKRENVENPNVREYIEVLDNKSQRLKQLTDDLVEASKISSGNIVLQWERINLIELLNQTRGEFSEKFEQKGLTPVIRAEKSSVLIEADSRRIWRVMENLFNNICKYALQGTRVYIDVAEKYGENGSSRVVLSIKNISENPIKVNADELTERFIRGDESRTTEGSGLGLSIARNLTEAMKGQFEITVDGDLFKVTLTFPLLEEQTLS
jgi:signal transduction histidine kinase